MKFNRSGTGRAICRHALLVGETVIYQPAFPKTLLRLEAAGMHVRLLDQSELAKAEGGLTCCSLIFKKQG